MDELSVVFDDFFVPNNSRHHRGARNRIHRIVITNDGVQRILEKTKLSNPQEAQMTRYRTVAITAVTSANHFLQDEESEVDDEDIIDISEFPELLNDEEIHTNNNPQEANLDEESDEDSSSLPELVAL